MTNRRQFVKKAGGLAVAASLPSFSFNIMNRPRLDEDIIGHGDFRYRLERNWSKLKPNNSPVVNCHEMVMDKRKRLIMVTDHPKNNVLITDTSGNLLDSWTLNFKSAHGLTIVDEGGEEMLFITDPNTGTVVKTTLDGKIVLTLNPKKEGFYGDCQSFGPTETAIAANGDIYVADGYGSQFITQYDSQGKGIRKFGGDSFLQKNKFKQVHGVAIDARDKENPTLLCSARIKNAFKRFSLEGEFIEDIYLPGAFVSRPVIDDDMLYSGVCFGMQPNKPIITQNLGFVTIIDTNNKVVSNPGGKAPMYVDGELQTMYQDKPIFKHCHDVCLDDDKNLYVLQWNAKGVYPYKLHRI
ncbi:MAG: 6-bladed beta-propeller [Flavobacteriaceae bacterium]|nr:MAG: 6-bladed beta-propeller [Flavobacteriaceae bacterium]